MLSPETLQRYREMTPGQRLELTFRLMDGLEKSLLSGTPQQVDRKFELLRRENDLRNQNMLTAIARTKVTEALGK
jgi:hypothetical protein